MEIQRASSRFGACNHYAYDSDDIMDLIASQTGRTCHSAFIALHLTTKLRVTRSSMALFERPPGLLDDSLQSSRKQETLPVHVASSAEHCHNIRALLGAPTAAHWDVLHVAWSAFELLL
jgi:hypothetical protein